MKPEEVPTIRQILEDFIDADDPFYADMLSALEQRENILRIAAVAHALDSKDSDS